MLSQLRTSQAAVGTGLAKRQTRIRTIRCASSKSEAVKQLEQFQSVMSAQLKRTEEELKTTRTAAASSGTPAVETTVPGVPAPPALQELDKDSFWPFLEENAKKLVVVDFYTDWCGPCKLMYPTLCKWNEELASQNVVIVKVNCNQHNKELGKALGIKVAPTFHLYRNKERLHVMTGAKQEKLRELIDVELAPLTSSDETVSVNLSSGDDNFN